MFCLFICFPMKTHIYYKQLTFQYFCNKLYRVVFLLLHCNFLDKISILWFISLLCNIKAKVTRNKMFWEPVGGFFCARVNGEKREQSLSLFPSYLIRGTWGDPPSHPHCFFSMNRGYTSALHHQVNM